VSGTSARLYVNGADEPTLIVNDLKQPPVKGALALWVGPGTIAHFSGLKVSQRMYRANARGGKYFGPRSYSKNLSAVKSCPSWGCFRASHCQS